MLHIYDQYFDGSDLTLLNSFYIKSNKDKAGWSSRYVVMVARDNSTGEKVDVRLKILIIFTLWLKTHNQ